MECKLLQGVIESRSFSIQNPMNGMDYLEVRFYDVTFSVNFGPWRAGDKAYSLTFDPFHCTLTEGDCWDALVKSCEVTVIVVPPLVTKEQL